MLDNSRIERWIVLLSGMLALLVIISALQNRRHDSVSTENRSYNGSRGLPMVVLDLRRDLSISSPFNLSVVKAESPDGVWLSWNANSSQHLAVPGRRHRYLVEGWSVESLDKRSDDSRPDIGIGLVNVTDATRYVLFIPDELSEAIGQYSVCFEVIQNDTMLASPRTKLCVRS